MSVSGSEDDDTIAVAGSAGDVQLEGLPVAVAVASVEPADVLHVGVLGDGVLLNAEIVSDE